MPFCCCVGGSCKATFVTECISCQLRCNERVYDQESKWATLSGLGKTFIKLRIGAWDLMSVQYNLYLAPSCDGYYTTVLLLFQLIPVTSVQGPMDPWGYETSSMTIRRPSNQNQQSGPWSQDCGCRWWHRYSAIFLSLLDNCNPPALLSRVARSRHLRNSCFTFHDHPYRENFITTVTSRCRRFCLRYSDFNLKFNSLNSSDCCWQQHDRILVTRDCILPLRFARDSIHGRSICGLHVIRK